MAKPRNRAGEYVSNYRALDGVPVVLQAYSMPYVYVIAGGRRHVKVGHTINVKKRLAGLQTGCPFTLRIAGSWHSERATEIERHAHRILEKYRWAGEWFDVPQRVATLTVSMLVAAYPSHLGQDQPAEKAIVFCRSCQHSGILAFIPDHGARFRCTKCESREHVHVIDFVVNLLKRR